MASQLHTWKWLGMLTTQICKCLKIIIFDLIRSGGVPARCVFGILESWQFSYHIFYEEFVRCSLGKIMLRKRPSAKLMSGSFQHSRNQPRQTAQQCLHTSLTIIPILSFYPSFISLLQGRTGSPYRLKYAFTKHFKSLSIEINLSRKLCCTHQHIYSTQAARKKDCSFSTWVSVGF